MKALVALEAAVLLAAAFASSAAADHARPDDRAVGARSVPPPLEAGSSAATLNYASSTRPDDRAGLRGAGASAPVSTPLAVHVDRPGFDWGDAGIGAVAGAGLVVLLLGAAALIRHERAELRPV